MGIVLRFQPKTTNLVGSMAFDLFKAKNKTLGFTVKRRRIPISDKWSRKLGVDEAVSRGEPQDVSPQHLSVIPPADIIWM